MADALHRLYQKWTALCWPIGTPSGNPDWSDVETAFRAGYYEGRADRISMDPQRQRELDAERGQASDGGRKP